MEVRFEILMAVTMKITVLYMLWKKSAREGNESRMPNGRQCHSKTPENTDLLFLWQPNYLPGQNFWTHALNQKGSLQLT